MIIHRKFHQRPNISPLKRRDFDPVVQSGLAISPQDALEMAEQGIPISAAAMRELPIEQRRDVDMYVPPERCRHWDIADGFQAHMDLREKMKAVKKGVKDGTIVNVAVEPSNPS